MIFIPAGTYEITAANQPRFNRQPPATPAIQFKPWLLVVHPCSLERFLQTRRNSHATVDRASIHQRQRHQPFFHKIRIHSARAKIAIHSEIAIH